MTEEATEISKAFMCNVFYSANSSFSQVALY